MNNSIELEKAAGDYQQSGNYEYSVHPTAKISLQIFNTKTMSSTFFTAKETLALLDYLTQLRSQIEAVATDETK